MIRTWAAWLWLCVPFTATACDVCGIFLGVQPNDRRSTIGLFYRSRIMEGITQVPLTSQLLPKHGGHIEVGVPYVTVPMEEIVTVAELRADLRLSERFFLLASVPLTNTYRGINNFQVLDAYGMGDPFAMIRYQLANTRDIKDHRYVHRFLVGGGVKAPLGKNDLQIDDVPVSPDVQLGTGSWDALFSVEYSVRRGRTGGGVSGLARFNGSNSVGYHLGNGFSSTTEVFHRFGTDTLSFAPALGAYGEWMGLDHVQGVADHGTGGLTVFSHAGIRVWWKRMSFSAYYQHALLNQVGEFITPTQQRVVVGLTFNINKN
ncbi:MAG: hypothetical protein IPH05_16905 [Flavobacteriales bacterium]|jgi:hypothetical protein|nr:hypothetical protein [Flavobacteriales bacterium]MBK6548825.1 hypothetical protein [Flavobacteriales bacterium]MBK6884577.1 hypothetical protein [Flavobacteriales bacterium]MBK7100979.1 hypothetical protein [Flavobacteriales bacterium]MBK7111662.1 hypothetical protein [Flavobacteriales bacterium]